MSKVIIFCILLHFISYSQPKDTIISKSDSVKSIPPLLAQNKYQYLNPDSPDTVTRNTILWLPLKNIQNIFDYLPGYQLNYTDVGQQTKFEYNLYSLNYISFLRKGRLLNDLVDGQVDLNLISRNEVAELELSNNSLYTTPLTVNIIDRQIFRNKPYTEITYWQDRYENLYFDGNFHKNIFKSLNFNFGITKHSYDGKYTNSDFDKWQGRFNLNYIGSERFNSFLSVNYSHIQRGLNEGLDSSVNINYPDSLLSSDANVKNSDAYERRTRFDIDLGFLFAYGKEKNNWTKVQFFTSNSYRAYRDEENRPNPNGIYIEENTHWIDYGAKVIQNFSFNFTRGLTLNSKTEAEVNRDIVHLPFYSNLNDYNRIFFSQSFLWKIKQFEVKNYLQIKRFDYFNNKFYFSGGVESNYINGDSVKSILIKLGYTYDKMLPSYFNTFASLAGGFNSISPEVYTTMRTFTMIRITYYDNSFGLIANLYKQILQNNYNNYKFQLGCEFNLNHSGLQLQGNVNFNFNKYYNNPLYFGNIILAYNNYFFKKKLKIKIGINSKFWDGYTIEGYYGRYNYYKGPVFLPDNNNAKTPANATLDFFIIGKIDKATFGLTLENILNRAAYNTGLYPYQDRGGLFKVISRFNITWYFLD